MASTHPINLLWGKSDVNVKACAVTVIVRMLTLDFTAFKLKDPKKNIRDINLFYI
jgi:hypothetical protein